MVRTHAQTMRPATPQRTAEALVTEPTPTMAPVMVCAVETGTPRCVARNSVMAPPVSAQKPPTGFSLVEAVDEVEDERHHDDDGDEQGHRSGVLQHDPFDDVATSSHRSVAFSRAS